MDINFIVNVRCMTFNHAPYIEDAMNGFCIQETTFPFVCTIIDDASIDGEPEVIKKYLQDHFNLEDKLVVRNEETDDYVMTFAQHKTNMNCYFAVYYLKYNHYSIKKSKIPYIQEWQDQAKYIALCEGDDYWTDKTKLQKQVDILENNPNVTMVYTSFKTIDDRGAFLYRPFFENIKKIQKDGELLSELFLHNFIMTLTVCYRKSILNELFQNSPYKHDYCIFLSAAMQGYISYISDETGCYRKVSASVTNTKLSIIVNRSQEVFFYFATAFFNNPPSYLTPKDIVKCKKMIAKRLSYWGTIKKAPISLLLNRGIILYLFESVLHKVMYKTHIVKHY